MDTSTQRVYVGGTAPFALDSEQVWFSSDQHFGHANIITYTGRPFQGWWEMDEWLVTTWNETVPVDADVWVLGDICMGKLGRSLQLVSRLNGRLHLVSGNHDRVFRRHAPRPAWEERYLDAGFATIWHGVVDITVDGQPYRLCHFPYRGDSGDHDRYVDQRPIDDGVPLIHGHTHGRWRRRGHMIDIGVDAWGGRPVRLDTVVDLFNTDSADIEPIPWER